MKTKHTNGEHCPECFNGGYDSGLNGITPAMRDKANLIPEVIETLRACVGDELLADHFPRKLKLVRELLAKLEKE